jgi:polyisoprenoid-binding protein YceI
LKKPKTVFGLAGNRVVPLLCAFLLLAIGVAAARVPQTPATAPGSELTLSLDADKSEVHWTLDTSLHTVHGTFKFKSGQLQFDPNSGKASGEIVVAATSGDSGNEGRDKKMHGDVLESSRFQDIIFKADRVEGKVAASGNSNVLVHGILTLHGAGHEFGVPVQAELTGDHWKATTKFTIPFLQWGLKNPSNWLLKVKPDVNLEITMTGSLKSSSGN